MGPGLHLDCARFTQYALGHGRTWQDQTLSAPGDRTRHCLSEEVTSMRKHEDVFALFLRLVGTVALAAVVAIVMPFSWMNAVHQWLGMGPLPNQPIVGYLARSTSAFYAVLGGLLWVVSFDLRRHRVVLQYLGLVMVALGIMLGIIDFAEGMPKFWKWAEGPLNAVIGLVILLFTL
jgi:hypothetical protein